MVVYFPLTYYENRRGLCRRAFITESVSFRGYLLCLVLYLVCVLVITCVNCMMYQEVYKYTGLGLGHHKVSHISSSRSAVCQVIGKMTTSGVIVKASPVKAATPWCFERDEIHKKILFRSLNCEDVTGPFCFVHGDVDRRMFRLIEFNNPSNSLLTLCHIAFAQERPMALTPDELWYYIRKGISIHIHQHSEDLRKLLVRHNDKVELKYYSENTPPDDEDMNTFLWSMRKQIEGSLTELGKGLISTKFSTTTTTIDEVSCISLMESMDEYFSFVMTCICGIPSVCLLGTRQDWVDLEKKAAEAIDVLSGDDLAEDLSLAWWKNGLLSVLRKLVECYDNPEVKENEDWMARIYKSEAQVYGGHYDVCGWVNVFFPYLVNARNENTVYRKNEWAVNHLINPELGLKKYLADPEPCDRWQRSEISHYLTRINDYPRALSSVNFDWIAGGETHKMTMNGGPCCVSEQINECWLPCPPGTLHTHFGLSVYASNGGHDLC